MPYGVYDRTKSKPRPPCSEEHKRRMRLVSKGNKYCLGKKHTKETKRKISEKQKKNCENKQSMEMPNWKGGITPLNFLFRDLIEYGEWRKQVYERDNYICRQCGYEKGKILQAHHIKPFSKILFEFLKEYDQFSPIEDKETLLRLAPKYKPFWDVDNGITLCKKCHNHRRAKKVNINKICGVKYVRSRT